MSNIIALQVEALLDDQAVVVHFDTSERTRISVRLNARGIFDLRDEIEGLLRDCPEIHEWRSLRPAN